MSRSERVRGPERGTECQQSAGLMRGAERDRHVEQQSCNAEAKLQQYHRRPDVKRLTRARAKACPQTGKPQSERCKTVSSASRR